jgi:CRISPR-associated protein Cmr4
VLGSYEFTATGDPGLKGWAGWLSERALPRLDEHAFFRDKLTRDLFLVPDTALAEITRECTTVVARVQLGALDENDRPMKSVQHGPFYSEYLPSETLLAALLESRSVDHLDKLATRIDGTVIQVGGDETIGKGLMWCTLARATSATAAPTSETTNVVGQP